MAKPARTSSRIKRPGIKAWAERHGYDVNPDGRVPLVIQQAWDQAHGVIAA